MKDITHYFQSPTREDGDTEADILLNVPERATPKRSGSASAVKTNVPQSCAHVIVSCDARNVDGADAKRRKRKVKRKASEVIVGVETVHSEITITTSEIQETSQHAYCEKETKTTAKNSTKTNRSGKSKSSDRSCKIENALVSSHEKDASQISSALSDIVRKSGTDAFEVQMAVHMQNVGDDCVVAENEHKPTSVSMSDEGSANSTSRWETKTKRKHNLEEMIRRNRKRRSPISDDVGKQKCKKWKRVIVDESESEDVQIECVGSAIEECVGDSKQIENKTLSENVAVVQNAKDAKLKSQLKNNRADALIEDLAEGNTLVLEPDEVCKPSSPDLGEQDVLLVQYKKTLKHVRKAEKALRKFEKLKSLQEKLEAPPTRVPESKNEKLSELQKTLNNVEQSDVDIDESNTTCVKSILGNVFPKSVPSSERKIRKRVSSNKLARPKEVESPILDDSFEDVENCIEAKKKSIFSYFSRVSKEEVLTKPQRLSVKVLIHSPPSTPMKIKTRKKDLTPIISSQRRKSKRSLSNREVADNINVLGSEVLEILGGSSVDEDVTPMNLSVGDRKTSSLRNWKVRMVRVTSCGDEGSTDSGSEHDLVELAESSDSAFTPPKKRKDVRRAGRGRPRKVSARAEEKATGSPRASRRLAMKNCVVVDSKAVPSSSDAAEIRMELKQEDESSGQSRKSVAATTKAAVKLAPLFLQERTNRKSKPDPAVIEARKNFLMSGVPDAVQKMIKIQKSFEDQNYDAFPEVSHVQQIDDSHYVWHLPRDSRLQLKPEAADDCEPAGSRRERLALGTFTGKEPAEPRAETLGPPPPVAAFRKILREVKREFPDFPVYRTFRALRGKFLGGGPGPRARKPKRRGRGARPDGEDPASSQPHVLWAEKYRPLCVNDMICNLASARHLRAWLESWKKFVAEMNAAEKVPNADDSDGGSFAGDDDDNSGSEHGPSPVNAAVLVGPAGSGKTAAVYAVAGELDCKVLEINASSKRTGKRVLSEFLEATQSHQVRKSSKLSATSGNSFFKEEPRVKNGKKHSKLEESKHTQAEDHNSKKLSIILVEDADLVFEDQDDGFLSALSLLLSSSKRPVILTTSDPSCPHLSKWMQQYSVLQFAPPSAKFMCVWLQLVSLLEGSRLSHAALRGLFHASGRDMRRTIHGLQFWAQASDGCTGAPERLRALAPADGSPLHGTDVCADDDSNLVWASARCADETEVQPAPACDAALSSCGRRLPPPRLLLGTLWWNLGMLLGFGECRTSCLPLPGGCATEAGDTCESNKFSGKVQNNRGNVEDPKPVDGDEGTATCSAVGVPSCWVNKRGPQRDDTCLQAQMDSLSSLMDVLSETCVMYSGCLRLDDAVDLEPSVRPWERMTKDGLLLKEDVLTCNYASRTTSDDLCCYLVQESVQQCMISLASATNKGSEQVQRFEWTDALTPSADKLRRRAEAHRADEAASAAVCASSLLDRGAVAQDYAPLLRAIGRLERARLAGNAKRRNRFFHYLKGLGVDTTESVLGTMCSSFEES
ncbi:uncharacterized protein LOC134536819 isoform X2 [Bacillus rossius redtenbacheri]